MPSQAVSGPVMKDLIFMCWLNYPWSCNTVYLWKEFLWVANAFLDLEVLPHMSQAWETPVMWLASMWSIMWVSLVCFPQMLHDANNRPFVPRTSVIVIMDLICSSRSFIPVFSKAIVVSGFVELLCWMFRWTWFCLIFSDFTRVLWWIGFASLVDSLVFQNCPWGLST